MQLNKRFFSPFQSNDNTDPKDGTPHDESAMSSDNESAANTDEPEHGSEHKSFKTSLRDALQDWSNDDARDIEEDDSTPLRSGL